MSLELKKVAGGDFYAYYPDIAMHSPYRRYSMIIIREADTRQSVEALMEQWKLSEFAVKESCLLAFPNMTKTRQDTDATVSYLKDIHNKMCEPDDYVFETDSNGIPLLKCMLNRWHLMNDTRYYIGIGKGAEAACELALAAPTDVAAVACIGADESKLPLEKLKEIGMPYQLLAGTDFPFADFYQDFFKKIRRLNTGKFGDCAPRTDFDAVSFDSYIEDTSLGDQNGMPHTWFVHKPARNGKLPVMFFFHGGSDNPMEAAEMSKFHELGEKEGFLTVYPWGSDTASWNCNYAPEGYDDVAYIHALIDWMKTHYPVDESRIYLSGFSNGAAMAQIYAMEYPEQIAGVCHIDSNWPGHRLGLAAVDPDDVIAFQKGKKRKEEFDYRMPVWYTYGTREPSYPVYRGCSQQLQYDFWKQFNNIPIVETPERENPHPCGCGVPGEVCETLVPSTQYPEHVYQVNRFYSGDADHLNLYNYVMMHDKGHEVAPSDPVLAWQYVKQFKRDKDKTIRKVEQES